MKYDYPTIVIGAGAGGLVVAIGMAKAGKKILLIEKGNYGGDCTNFGCVPSKSLIAAAHLAHHIKTASKYGIDLSMTSLNGDKSLNRTRDIVKHIRDEEDPNALAKHGVDTLTGLASFVDPHTLSVALENGDTKEVTGNNIVIATGSYPRIPKVSGLEKINYRTNETIFDLEKIPESLAVMGGGPIGSELAQAFHRLGSQVSIIQHSKNLLMKEEPEAQEVLEKVFREEGIDLHLKTEVTEVQNVNGKISLNLNDQEKHVVVDELLISTGRKPNLEKLNLDGIGVEYNERKIITDKYGRTSKKNIWAIGDVAGHAIFTHIAENQGRTVLTNLLLPSPLKFKLDLEQPIPRVTYTDPEVASVGLTQEDAIKKYGEKKIAVYHFPFSKLDRAITTGRTEGFIKVVTKKWSSKILGATIVAPRAGEMLAQITTAMYANIPLRKLSSLIHAYPTYSLAVRKAADMWLSQTVLPSLFKLIGKK